MGDEAAPGDSALNAIAVGWEKLSRGLTLEGLSISNFLHTSQMREDAFTECVLERLAEHNEADGAEVCYHRAESRGRWPAAKLNAWSLSGDDAS